MAIFSAISNKSVMAVILLLELLMASLKITDAQTIGACYGRNGNNLPTPQEVIALYNTNGIGRMRIYDPDAATLQALRGSNIELIVDVPNDQLQGLASDASTATQWVQNNVQNYSPDVKFRYIAVGIEVKPGDTNAQFVLPAMQNIYSAIASAGLQNQIKVSTAIDTGLLGNSYPPSAGSFSASASSYITPIITFLVNHGSPLLANVYPYFSYVGNPQDIQLPYALFTSPGVVVTDGDLKYQNLFDALVDSLYSALEKAGGPNVAIVVSESGWPSEGGTAATADNAATYYKNLINHVKGGTPKKPGKAIETYLFAMFDENLKPAGIEQHFGLFSPNKQPKYQITDAQTIGACYGRNGNNLPTPQEVIALYNTNGIGRMRIYDPDAATLQALRGSNIELIVDVPNDQLQGLASDASTATQWVQNNVQNYSPDVKFRYIAVGIEVKPGDTNAQFVLPAMQNIYSAIASAGLQNQIKVSTAIDTGLLGNSYPPSAGSFSASASSYITPIITFLVNHGSPLLANVYPYFSYVGNPQDIQLPYALFTSPGVVVTDGDLKYQNLFDALVDSLYSALEKAGGPNVAIVVSESGWPSEGGTAATADNAATYYKNLINHVKGGTPKKPGKAIETYLFAMFDENLKPAGIEQHFGLFSPNKQPKYQITDAQTIGACYGRNGNNLPTPQEVIALYNTNGIGRMRIYDPDAATLQALRGSNIELIVDVPNDQLQGLASDASTATQWVQNNVQNYSPDVKFRYIAVGIEVKPGDTNAQFVLPAMQNIYSAIASAGLQNQIKVSTAIDTGLLGNSYPPSAGSFSASASSYITPIITFLVNHGSPLLANVYPYFSYVGNPQDIQLPYALFTSPGFVVTDGDLKYQNLFDALVDSLYSALEKAGGPNVAIVVSESGWPSEGGTAATADNAATYYKNLINHVKGGTPKKPGKAIETYLFAMFDENLKPAGIEQHFGLFSPNKQPKYQITDAQTIGACYGRNGNNLPTPQEVIALYNTNGIGRMRIYDPDAATLQALRGSNIELIVDVPNDQLQGLASDASTATQWVQNNVQNYSPDVKFRYIAVGIEVKPGDTNAQFVLPAMQNIYSAIASAGLQNQIKVSTAIDTGLLGNSYPPSAGSFSASASSYITPIITFLVNHGSPLLANVYPYFSYVGNPQDIQLPYALFTSPGVVVTDGDLKYQNLFDALVDSLYSALEKAGGPNVAIVVSESGWPSEGGTAATADNAATYYKNLINHVKGGTPKKPGKAIETYLFAMFDENLKPAGIEQHFGLFSPNKQPKYQIIIT